MGDERAGAAEVEPDGDGRSSGLRDALWRAAVENGPHGYLVLDAEGGRVLDFNRRFEEWFGLERADAGRLRQASFHDLAQACRSVVAVGPFPDTQALLDGAPAGGRRVATRAGRVLDWCSRALDCPAVSGGVLVVWEDVTAGLRADEERRVVEERTRELERLESLSALAGGVAHRLNNLLTGILGSTELVLDELEPHEPARRPLERVMEAGARAAELCQQMLASAGSAVGEVRRCHLSDLAHRALEPLLSSRPAGVDVREELEPDLPLVLADEAQVRQAFEALLTNAFEALEGRGGLVAVATGVSRMSERDFEALPLAPRLPAGEYVWLEVRDDGPGMDSPIRSRMFEPFFSTKFAGRGLGLTAAARIVRSHRGALAVESAPGEGSRVRLLFPGAA